MNAEKGHSALTRSSSICHLGKRSALNTDVSCFRNTRFSFLCESIHPFSATTTRLTQCRRCAQ
jgi:hypothetical protein